MVVSLVRSKQHFQFSICCSLTKKIDHYYTLLRMGKVAILMVCFMSSTYIFVHSYKLESWDAVGEALNRSNTYIGLVERNTFAAISLLFIHLSSAIVEMCSITIADILSRSESQPNLIIH